METGLLRILVFLVLCIALIILLTARFRVHAFFALLLACFLVGIGVGMPVPEILSVSKEGFGKILQSLGFVIVLGTTLGSILEHTSATTAMASAILKLVGEKRAPLAMNISGFIVGMPIFCDSGYIVLSGLNKSLSQRAQINAVTMAGSLASGLYAVHCMIPPHPGASAAAGILKVDIGTMVLYGLLMAVPASVAGFWWSVKAGKKYASKLTADQEAEVKLEEKINAPAIASFTAFLPVIIPIMLIALKSFLPENEWLQITGDPVIALSIGIVLAAISIKKWERNTIAKLLQEAAEKAAGILVIIGAGGAFGAILAATDLGHHLGKSVDISALGIAFPFLLTALLKTAQGSSTVAIITASSIILPLLPSMHLQDGNGPLFAVLAMGAGSMMVSHANDAYFWVVAKFSHITVQEMLRVYTVSTIIMAITALASLYCLQWIMSFG